MNWIPHPTVLEGRMVRLEPLAPSHFEALLTISQRPEIWTHLPCDGTDRRNLERELRSAMLQRAQGMQYPFTIIDAHTGAVIGSTRLFDLHPEHKKLEIGWTWYDPAYWGSGHNLECKLLLFRFCFDTLKVHRIQLKTRDTNQRSQAAIQKVGAVYEGTLRKDRVMPDGRVRDTMVYSVLDDDWPEVERRLEDKVAAIQGAV